MATARLPSIALGNGSSRYHCLDVGHVRRRTFRGVGTGLRIADAYLDRIDRSGSRDRANTVAYCKSATENRSYRVQQMVGRVDRSGIPVDALCSLWIVGRGTCFRDCATVRTRPFTAAIWVWRNSIAVAR